MALPTILAPLRHRPYLLLSLSSLFTFFGAHIQNVGAAWEMTSLTNSATLVALIQTAGMLPALLFALVAGAMADMIDRRRMLMTAQALMLVSGCLLVTAQVAGWMTPWLLLGLTFLLNIGTALRMPAQSALANDLVEPQEVPAAVALTGIGSNLGRSVGPGLGGILVAAAGVQAAFIANIVCVIAAFATTTTWRVPSHAAPGERVPIGPAIAEGLRYCRDERLARVLLIRIFFWVFCGVGIWALLPLVARHLVGGGPTTLGILLGCQGIGAVTGALFMSHWYERAGVERLLRISTCLMGCMLLLVSMEHSLFWMIPTTILAGIGWMIYMSAPSAALQMLAPKALRGRVVSTSFMVMYAGFGFGSAWWGMVADLSSVRTALALAGAGVLVNLLLAWWLPYRPASKQTV